MAIGAYTARHGRLLPAARCLHQTARSQLDSSYGSPEAAALRLSRFRAMAPVSAALSSNPRPAKITSAPRGVSPSPGYSGSSRSAGSRSALRRALCSRWIFGRNQRLDADGDKHASDDRQRHNAHNEERNHNLALPRAAPLACGPPRVQSWSAAPLSHVSPTFPTGRKKRTISTQA